MRMTRQRSIVWLIAIALLSAHAVSFAGQATGVHTNRWEAKIRQFEQQDAQQVPPADGFLFVGSSSIVGWDLDRWLGVVRPGDVSTPSGTTATPPIDLSLWRTCGAGILVFYGLACSGAVLVILSLVFPERRCPATRKNRQKHRIG